MLRSCIMELEYPPSRESAFYLGGLIGRNVVLKRSPISGAHTASYKPFALCCQEARAEVQI